MMLTVPALLFLVQVVFFLPAVFFAAGILLMLWKAVTAGHVGDGIAFTAFFGAHLLVYAALYYGVAALLAWLVALIRSTAVQVSILVLLCLGLVAMAFFPLYGGGGHGPMFMGTLAELPAELEKEYGEHAFAVVYGGALALYGALLLRAKLRRRG